MTNNYPKKTITKTRSLLHLLLFTALPVLTLLSSSVSAQTCPDPGGGRRNGSLSASAGRSETIYPGAVPGGHSGTNQGTVGYLINTSTATNIYLDNVVTLYPLLGSVMGGVALRFELLSLPAPDAVIEIFQGEFATGTPAITITEANHAPLLGTSVSYNGPVTVRFSSPTPALSGDFNVEIRYMTGDQIITSCFGHPVAAWTDFVQPDSHTFIDDSTLGLANTLPICIGYFDSDRAFVSSEVGHCLIHPLRQIGVTSDSYPGETNFVVSDDKTDFDHLGSSPEIQELKMARAAWILANAPNVTPDDRAAIRNAVWTTMGENYEAGYGGLHSQAQAAVPNIPVSLPAAPSLSMSAAPASAVPGDPIVFTLNVTGGTAPMQVRLHVPAGITIDNVTGATLSGGYLDIPSTPATVEITATSATEQTAALQAVFGSLTDYYNIDNLTYFIPCQRTGQDPFQDFLGYSAVEQAFPGSEASATWDTSLPVSLVSFEASEERSAVNLTWTTASEQNNQGFEIQRSGSDGTWSRLGFVERMSSGGNSSRQLIYRFTDAVPHNGLNYYRLKQVDFDGTFEYSMVKSVRVINADGLALYPNPTTTGRFRLRNAVPATGLELFDLIGSRVMAWSSVPDGDIDISKLPSGLYIAKIRHQDGSYSTSKITVIK